MLFLTTAKCYGMFVGTLNLCFDEKNVSNCMKEKQVFSQTLTWFAFRWNSWWTFLALNFQGKLYTFSGKPKFYDIPADQMDTGSQNTSSPNEKSYQGHWSLESKGCV